MLDEYARKRRQRRQLDSLEMDNFGDDPHANVAKAKKLPSFIDSSEGKIFMCKWNCFACI